MLRPQTHNLIGHDFLQATKSKIDFSRGDKRAFVEGKSALEVHDVVRLKITRKEAKALRACAAELFAPKKRSKRAKRMKR